jgi:hypothetical protein
MSLKFPMKGSEMQSLYSLAWFGKRATSSGGEDPVFSGYHAVETATEFDADADLEETAELTVELPVRTEGMPNAEEVDWARNRRRRQAERIMHLLNLGYTGL